MSIGTIILNPWVMYKQGDIIIVQYPFSDKPKRSKKRPAIIVSNEKSNMLDNDLLICPITSTIRSTPFSYLISNNDTDADLPKASEIRCNKIITIRKNLIIQKFSEVKTDSLPKILDLVRSSF